MEDFLTKLQKISKQSNSLILEKSLIEKRIANIQENINEYDKMKEKYVKEVELKKNQLLNNKNKHLMKCQKMEELNNKLNEILIRKQNIDDEEDKLVALKQMDIVNKTFYLLKNVQMLSDSLETTTGEYKLIAEQMRNQNFNNRKTINMLNCFLKKNLTNIRSREESETDEKADRGDEYQNQERYLGDRLGESVRDSFGENVGRSEIGKTQMSKEIKAKTEMNVNEETYKMLTIFPTKEMNKNLINIFSQSHTTLPIEKQQFLFVFEMNILNRIINEQRKRKNKSAKMKSKVNTGQECKKESDIKGEKEKEEEEEEEEKGKVKGNGKDTEDEKKEEEKEEGKKKEKDECEKDNEKYNKMIHQFIYQYYITA